jgi:hypothetical protein
MSDNFVIVETEYGVEISVEDMETADEFDDFLTEDHGISTYLRPIDNGMTFGLGKGYTREQAEALPQAFLDKRTRP